MAFTEAERVEIRKYMGAGSIYLQLFPKLENAITSVQSIADGGSQADSSTEDSIRSYLTKLAALETKLEALHCQAQVVQAGRDEVMLDVAKGIFLLRSEGRRMVGTIARSLACAPVWDFFSGMEPSGNNGDFRDPYSWM